MKKAFQIIGICALTCFSFYYMNKIMDLSRSKDPIMQEIVNVKSKYEIQSVNAYIKDDTITSGVSGIKVDVDESYAKMKKLGEYNKNLLVFINDYPKVSIKNNYDNFVVGASDTKKEVAIVFVLDDMDSISIIKDILKRTNINAYFFMDGKLLESNNDYINEIVKNGNMLGNLGYDGKYDSTRLKYTNSLIYRYTKKDNKYCYSDNDKEIISFCKKLSMYTIKGISIDNYSNLKDYLSNGIIIKFNDNKYTVKSLEMMLNYIKQKGYSVKLLDDLLVE